MANKLYTKVAGVWKEITDVSAKVSGVWKTCEAGWIKVGDVWKQMFTAAYIFSPTISSNEANYDIRAKAITDGWNGSDDIIITATINPGIVCYATTTSNYGFRVPSVFPAESEITVTNNGTIVGKGGRGGNGGVWPSSKGAAGSSGGTGLYLQRATSLTNTGTIAAGGGGGGGGAGFYIANPSPSPKVPAPPPTLTPGRGGGGGGGSSQSPAPGGTSPARPGGAGGTGGGSGTPGPGTFWGRGGNGGSRGASGGTGSALPPPYNNPAIASPSAGGGPGKSINGLPHIPAPLKPVGGTINGPQV